MIDVNKLVNRLGSSNSTYYSLSTLLLLKVRHQEDMILRIIVISENYGGHQIANYLLCNLLWHNNTHSTTLLLLLN